MGEPLLCSKCCDFSSANILLVLESTFCWCDCSFCLEYAQPLVGGIVGTLHQRSTFKPEEGNETSYADMDPYNSPEQEIYHAYAEPLPITGPEYATPIVMDMSSHPAAPPGISSVSTFKASGSQALPLAGNYNKLASRTENLPPTHVLYDTPKGVPGVNPLDELVYQVPQNMPHPSGNKEAS